MQAFSFEHSELVMHSGRQLGGLPKYSSEQAHEGEPAISLQTELGPHGEGSHGFT